MKEFQVVMLWELHDYSCKKTVLTYEALEALCVIQSGTPFASSLDMHNKKIRQKNESKGTYFLTVGERGIVRIWSSERYGMRVVIIIVFLLTFSYYVIDFLSLCGDP